MNEIGTTIPEVSLRALANIAWATALEGRSKAPRGEDVAFDFGDDLEVATEVHTATKSRIVELPDGERANRTDTVDIMLPVDKQDEDIFGICLISEDQQTGEPSGYVFAVSHNNGSLLLQPLSENLAEPEILSWAVHRAGKIVNDFGSERA